MARILVVDDDPSSVELITLMLVDHGHVANVASSGVDALRIAPAWQPDAILLDRFMPEMDGLQCLTCLKRLPQLVDVPVIMVTADHQDGTVGEALELGASDYVTKPFSERVLLARIGSVLRLKQSQDALREANRRLESLASLDSLTGLYNRRSFIDLAERELARAARYQRPVVIGVLDVDHFKRINDQYGHMIGDQVLQRIAAMFSVYFRKVDIVGRIGGEEFSFCMPDTTLEQAGLAGRRFCDELSSAGVNVDLRGQLQNVPVTACIGFSQYHRPNQTLQELLDIADMALYKAKSSGRNRVVLEELATDGMTATELAFTSSRD